ncbi:BTB/POZ domain-containing protein At5g17580-like [Hibiscus syriacus]|uniref:BTB/POZ domain-containing protein At5g17580-like n=1 Tax=Hibiscus syriacus TaxID=106335 RepID=UPI00192355BF|nr:BTB/POZ domain-containing protein At5g17580-like [Hibiscus syriacus]
MPGWDSRNKERTDIRPSRGSSGFGILLLLCGVELACRTDQGNPTVFLHCSGFHSKAETDDMTERQYADASSRMSKSASSTGLEVHVGSMPFSLDKELLASKSAKVAALLKENSNADLYCLLRDIPADLETFELVARFCHGYAIHMSSENIVPLICLSFHLGMDENHCNNNLLSKAVTFFEQRVLPSWNEIIKALRSSEKSLQQTMQLGLFDACLHAMIAKASDNPQHLGERIIVSRNDGDGGEKPNAKRRLFALDWQEDLTTLSLQLYEPIIYTMKQHEIPPEYISASIYRYAKKSIFCCSSGRETVSIYKRRSQRNVIETLEKLLPHGRELLPCTLLSKMLRSAIELEASSGCRKGFEIRIGKQLDQAKVKDLSIPCQGYAKEVQYDIECIRRILKEFYDNYDSSDALGFIKVTELMEEFLAEVACDASLVIDTFISLAEMSRAAALGTKRNSDGIYRAIDVYLEKNAYLTDKEKEQICKVLDFQKMSAKACEHATKNERLPVRAVVQVLFMAQLQLQETTARAIYDDHKSGKEYEEEEEEEEEVRLEMEKMSIKVKELEKDCHEMKKEITNGSNRQRVNKGKQSLWSEMKRKFGCSTNMDDLHCPTKKKKVHPKWGII